MKKIIIKLIPVFLGIVLALSWTLVANAELYFGVKDIVIYNESSSTGLVVITSVPNPSNKPFYNVPGDAYQKDGDTYQVGLMLPGDSFAKDFKVANNGSETHVLWFWTGEGESVDNWTGQDKPSTWQLLEAIELKIYTQFLDASGNPVGNRVLFYDGPLSGHGAPASGANPALGQIETNRGESGAYPLLTMAAHSSAMIYTEVYLDGEEISNDWNGVKYKDDDGVMKWDFHEHSCRITWFFMVARDTPPTSTRPPTSYNPPNPSPSPSVTPTTPTGTPGTQTPTPTEQVPENSVPGFGPSPSPSFGPGTPTRTPNPSEIITPTPPPGANPQTGDAAQMVFYMVGALISLTALGFILMAMKVRRDGALFKKK